MNKSAKKSPCPCGGADYAKCCGRFLDGGAIPQTAEEMMRSRYTAYTQANEAYLRATWTPETLPEEEKLAEDGVKWIGLEIKKHRQQDDMNATVEFVARFKIDGRAHRLHEISRFVRDDGKWYYLDGSFPER